MKRGRCPCNEAPPRRGGPPLLKYERQPPGGPRCCCAAGVSPLAYGSADLPFCRLRGGSWRFAAAGLTLKCSFGKKKTFVGVRFLVRTVAFQLDANLFSCDHVHTRVLVIIFGLLVTSLKHLQQPQLVTHSLQIPPKLCFSKRNGYSPTQGQGPPDVGLFPDLRILTRHLILVRS